MNLLILNIVSCILVALVIGAYIWLSVMQAGNAPMDQLTVNGSGHIEGDLAIGGKIIYSTPQETSTIEEDTKAYIDNQILKTLYSSNKYTVSTDTSLLDDQHLLRTSSAKALNIIIEEGLNVSGMLLSSDDDVLVMNHVDDRLNGIYSSKTNSRKRTLDKTDIVYSTNSSLVFLVQTDNKYVQF